MQNKFITFFRNCAYALFSNLISLAISIGFVFIVPMLIGVEAYGYWQLYLFYLSYTGFFHFGWIEGIYLKYGGSTFDALDANSFRTQFWILNASTVFLSVSFLVFLSCFVEDIGRQEIGYFIAANLLFILPKTFLAYILLSVGRIRAHSALVLTERFVSVAGMACLFLAGYRQYQALILADMAGKFVALGMAAYFCWNFVWGRFSVAREVFLEIGEHIASGSKLMFANIAGMLMLGILRFAIEQHWGVATFGKVSMALSAANLFLVFVGAVNVVLFPLLRRAPATELVGIYESLRALLSGGALGALLLYYPIVAFLAHWLPKYQESSLYLALLFPLCVYESKWTLLLYPYLKTLRKEKTVLLINLIALAGSAILAGLAVLWLENLSCAVLSVTVLTALRCALAEFFLARSLAIWRLRSSLQEFGGSALFIYAAYLLSPECGAGVYASAYLVYLAASYRKFWQAWKVVAGWILWA